MNITIVRPEGFGYYIAGYFSILTLSDKEKSFESLTEVNKFTSSGAPGGIRTPNDCFEGSYDIHFTTGAELLLYTKIAILKIKYYN